MFSFRFRIENPFPHYCAFCSLFDVLAQLGVNWHPYSQTFRDELNNIQLTCLTTSMRLYQVKRLYQVNLLS